MFSTIRTAAMPALLMATMAMAGQPLLAQAPAEGVRKLVDVLRLSEVMNILRAEGMTYGADLEAELFPGQGRGAWEATVAEIYNPERMEERFLDQFTAELEQSPHVPEMIAFFSSDEGRRIVELELSARQALLDETIEADSRERLEEMRTKDASRVELIEAFVQANDLVESNVAGALNSNLAFYHGMIEGGAFDVPISEQEVLADVWSQEEAIRDETRQWIYAYLATAYRPLSDEVLRDYINFSRTEAGRALNRALFAGFDAVLMPISRQLGLAAARYMSGEEI